MNTSFLAAGAMVCLLTTVGLAQPSPEAPRGGVGIAIDSQQGVIVIAGVKPDGPAANAGVRAGDVLLAVDGRSAAQIGLDGIPAVVSGPVGTTVELAIVTPGQQPRAVRLQRSAGVVVRPPAPPADPQPGPPASGGDNPFTNPFGNPPPATPSATTGAVKLRPYVIHDPAVNNVVACVPLVPEGWQARGQVVWSHHLAKLADLQLEITDPATGAGLQWLPGQTFAYYPNPPMPIQVGAVYMGKVWCPAPNDPAEIVANLWANELPELRGLRPAAKVDFPVDSARWTRAMGDPNSGNRAYSLKLRYAYNRGGQPWEADVYFTIGISPMLALNGVGWIVTNPCLARAPAGQLDRMPVLNVIRGSAEMTPDWQAGYQICQNLFRQGLMAQLNDSIAFGQKLTEYRQHQAQLSQQIHQERMASADARNQSFRETLGGVENYSDPVNRREVYLPAGYKDYWVNDRGEYLLVEQVGVDPNAGTTERWQRMSRIDPMTTPR